MCLSGTDRAGTENCYSFDPVLVGTSELTWETSTCEYNAAVEKRKISSCNDQDKGNKLSELCFKCITELCLEGGPMNQNPGNGGDVLHEEMIYMFSAICSKSRRANMQKAKIIPKTYMKKLSTQNCQNNL